MIRLISASSEAFTASRCSPIRILQDYLKTNGIETRVYDFWFEPKFIDDDFRKFSCVQEIPKYDSIMKALNGDLQDSGGRFLSDIIKLANRIEPNDNDIFGFSTTVLSHYAFILFALIIKKKNPNVKIVFGGYHISLGDKYSKFLLEKGIADFVVKNDGCKSLYNIYHGIEKEKYIIGNFIPNFWPTFDRIDAELSNNVLSTITSYGCNNNCYFCASDRKFHDCDMKKFEEYLQLMTIKGFRHAELNDDNANITSKRFLEIAHIMKRCNIEDWMCFVNAINTIDIPKDSNLKRVLLGAECFSDKLFKIINKNQSVEQVLKTIDFYIRNDVDVYCNIIVGLPGETEEEFENHFKIMEILRKKYNNKVTFVPIPFRIFPGSYMYNNPEKFDITFTYWKDTDIPKDFFIEGLNIDIVKDRIKKINQAFPPKPIPYHDEKHKTILIRRS